MKRKIISVLLASSMIFLSSGSLFNTSFAINNAKPLWNSKEEKNKIVVISDIHLGIKDEYTETLKNRNILINFLKNLQNTSDVRELVIAGDFLDEWFLPVDYPSYTDQKQFYKDVISNNKDVIQEFNNVTKKGIKLVYVPGNHDMMLEYSILKEAIPKITIASEKQGLGTYYTGDRNEIAIEHGHRYDVFSAPDTVTNAELCKNDNTMLPAGYFYARYGATWFLEGSPKIEKNLPVVTNIPDKNNSDQYGAYIYYSILKDISERITPSPKLEDKIFDMKIAGFNDKYTYLDFYPAQQEDNTITAPVLFKNIQRTWNERQKLNNVKVMNSFVEASSGTLDWEYFFKQARIQYIENPKENVDIVVFGHTHVPVYQNIGNGKYYVNDGTWIDNNTNYPAATRTFTVITTGKKDTALLYTYNEDGSISDISASVSKKPSK
ncbi:MAG: metallophosphoesterase [Proteocatella sp.]